jgi:mono/diheme cytochrome c family protein
MYDQPRYEPLEASDFFDDGRSARPHIEGTIARGQLRDDETLYTGKTDGKLALQIPDSAFRLLYEGHPERFANKPYDELQGVELRRALVERGRRRFDIYCSVCHGRTGTGDGMIVRRGFRKPPSYHIDRLRDAPAGHFFDVVTRGFGAMPSFANRIDVDDRWAIVAYLRALQLSRNARVEDVPAEELEELEDLDQAKFESWRADARQAGRGGTRKSSDRHGATRVQASQHHARPLGSRNAHEFRYATREAPP